jgi:hypothetical protein
MTISAHFPGCGMSQHSTVVDIAWPVPWGLPLVIPAWPPTVRLPLRCSRIAHLVLLVLVLTSVGVCCPHRLASSPLFHLSPMLSSYPKKSYPPCSEFSASTNILEVCPSILLCRVLGSVRLRHSVTEGHFPFKKLEKKRIIGSYPRHWDSSPLRPFSKLPQTHRWTI